MIRNATAQSGFTLVEMLVVLAMTSVMVALMASTLPQIASMRRAERDAVDRVVADDLGAALYRELSGALDIGLVDNVTHNRFPMDGSRETIRFVAPARLGYKSWGIREVVIGLEHGPDGNHRLLRTLKPHRVILQNEENLDQVDEIQGNIISLDFAYLAVEEDGKTNWQDSWTEKDSLPAAIRFTLAIHNGTRIAQISRTATLE